SAVGGYAYDAAGRRITMTAGSQATVSYTYDAANRLTNITQGSEEVGVSYDAANRRIELTLPNGVTTTYGYDAASDLTGLNYADANGSVLGNIAYTYNTAGQRSGESGSLASNVLPPAITTPASMTA
ncbi:Rhs family protein, partial [mine drainage metagenome]